MQQAGLAGVRDSVCLPGRGQVSALHSAQSSGVWAPAGLGFLSCSALYSALLGLHPGKAGEVKRQVTSATLPPGQYGGLVKEGERKRLLYHFITTLA